MEIAWLPSEEITWLRSGKLRTYSGRQCNEVRIIPFTDTYEKGGLPPTLIAVFYVDCGQKLDRVVRRDEYDTQTGKTIIYVGAQISETKATSCRGVLRKVEVSAGWTFSGRAFEVRPLTSY